MEQMISKDVSQNTPRAESISRSCKCQGVGWYPIFDSDANGGRGKHVSKLCICKKIQRAKTGDIPEEFLGKKFSDVQVYKKGWNPEQLNDPGNEMGVAAAKCYVAQFEVYFQKRIGMFLLGPPGRGKTLICSIVYQELCELGFLPTYIHLQQFLDKLKTIYTRNKIGEQGVQEEELFEVIHEADVVFIDEIRITDKSGNLIGADSWQQGKILRILDSARTIVADSNFDLRWIEKSIGAHIASRIVGRCGMPIKIGGPDHRLLQGKQLQSEWLKEIV